MGTKFSFYHEEDISSVSEFFCNEIIDIDYGKCLKFNHCCYHERIVVTYFDGSKKYYRDIDSEVIKRLCNRLERAVPEHFKN